MAANRFATMLHSNTNKFTMILVYAILEWVLILLLLLNSLFSYFITKFADYFGLKPPCLWCSRVDHVLDPGKDADNIRANSICDRHASEISKLGYCHHHQKLAKVQELCENCSSGMVKDEEPVLSCSCCNQRLEEKLSWCNKEKTSCDFEMESNGAKKCDSTSRTEDHNYEGVGEMEDEHQVISDLDIFSIREIASEEECSKSFSSFWWGEKESREDSKDSSHGMEATGESCGSSNNSTRTSLVEDSWIEVADLQCLSYNGLHDSSDRLNPNDMIDFSAKESGKFPNLGGDEPQHPRIAELDVVAQSYQNKSDPETKQETDELPPALNSEEAANDEEMESFEASSVLATSEKGNDDSHSEPKKSQCQAGLPPSNDDGSKVLDLEAHEETAENTGAKDSNQTLNMEAEAEEEKLPETPTSLESLQNWQKKFLLLSERRDFSIEESLDGSEIMDGPDGTSTIERLKSALTAERKALRALYAELEEERSASAIAANQTMAMITRLHEEKATMQMEALQYQRMMEEQSEYDQEALQMLNELMVKREKEKQELKRELEVYRQKVSEYELKESLRIESPVRVTEVDDDDDEEEEEELSIDLNRKLGDSSGNEENNATSDEAIDLEELTMDCMKNMGELDDSLAEFEEERLSILDQLKSLEEKLLMMSSEGGEPLQLGNIDVKEESPPSFPEDGSIRNMAKRLLPLFNEADDEAEEEVGLGLEMPESHNSRIGEDEEEEGEREAKRVDVVKEVDRVYERLQALEEDREFLKQFTGPVKKGDEGSDLLQEIFQHLRDLKSVELRARNIVDE